MPSKGYAAHKACNLVWLHTCIGVHGHPAAGSQGVQCRKQSLLIRAGLASSINVLYLVVTSPRTYASGGFLGGMPSKKKLLTGILEARSVPAKPFLGFLRKALMLVVVKFRSGSH